MENELWLSRDDTGDAWYAIEGGEPNKQGDGTYHSGSNKAIFHPAFFHHFVQGARLRKGRKRKIKRILIELEK